MNASIEAILKKKPIVDYLDRKGINPSKTLSGGKYAYYCPLPGHEDKKSPSFIVWTNADYQNFHCFGCQRGYTVIHLLSFIEGISFKESLQRLSQELDISIEENLEFSLEAVQNLLADVHQQYYSSKISLAEQLMSVSSLCRRYLKHIEFDDVECGIMDRFWSEIDHSLADFDYDSIEETLRYLPDVLMQRREKFEDIKLERLRNAHRSSDQTRA